MRRLLLGDEPTEIAYRVPAANEPERSNTPATETKAYRHQNTKRIKIFFSRKAAKSLRKAKKLLEGENQNLKRNSIRFWF